jgi:hypothetical protein
MHFRGPIVTVDKIDVLIDSKIELLSVIQVLSNYYINQDTIIKGNKNYIQYLEKTFMDFSNDPFIIFFDKACEKEFSLSQPCCFFLTLDDSCEKIALRISSELQWKFLLKAPVQNRFLSLLSDFIKNTNFLQFFSDNYNAYTKILNNVIDVMGGSKYYPELEEYLGECFSFYKLIAAPMYAESYGPLLYNKSNETIAACVLGINFYSATSVDNRRRQQEYMVWHEFLHSFINPVSSARHKEIKKLSKFLKKIPEGYKTCYDTWTTYFNETLIRAITCRLVFLKYGYKSYDYLLNYEYNAGFIFVEEFAAILCEKFEGYRSRFASFKLFFSSLLDELSIRLGGV